MSIIEGVFHKTMQETPSEKLVLLVDFLKDNQMESLAHCVEHYYSCIDCKGTNMVSHLYNDELITKPCNCVK